MKEYAKRIIAFLMSVMLVLGYIPNITAEAVTQSSVTNQLNSLINQYANRTATSAQMLNGIQCKGFANWVFKQIFGVYIGPYPENANYKISNANAQLVGMINPGGLTEATSRELLNNAKPGDYIQVQRSIAKSGGRCGPHSMIVVAVKSDGVQVFDCNSDGRNTIKTYLYTWSKFDYDNRAMSLYHAYDYQENTSRPTYSNFWLSKKNTSMTEYKLGDTIEVNVDASNYDKLTIGIDKDGVGRVVTKDISSHYTFPSTDLGVGSYSIYVTVSNSNGYVDTNRLWFTISKPQYSNFSISKSVYLLGENIEVNVNASNYDGITVGIDKDGVGRVVTKNISSHYVFSSNELGEGSYSIYLTVWNSHGQGGDTNRLWFKVAKPLNLGNDFHAMIVNAHSQKPIMQNERGNVVLGTENRTNYDRTLWHFVRNSNNTYTIYSYNNNKCLDVQDCSDATGANVQCWTKQDNSVAWKIAQQWYIFRFSDGTLYLKSVCNPGVLELTNGSEADNTNIHLYTMSDSNAQKFILKVVDQNKNKLNYSISTSKATCKMNEKVNVSVGGNVDYVYNYKFHIVSPDGKEMVIDNKCNPNYSFSGSREGKYTIYAEIKNPYYTQSGSKTSKSVTINVSCAHNFGLWTTIKKATCAADGSEKRTCSICGKAESRALKATGHKYTDKVVAPTTTQKGYTLHTCTNCGSSYKDNYKDILKKQEDDRITITYDSCGGDLGVKNRGGIKGITTSVWSEIPKKSYLITLDPNGGAVSDKTKYVNAPFKAWYTSQDAKGTRYNTGQTVSFTKSMTLYAAYGNAEIGNLPAPSRSGYTFNGWYLSSGTKVSSDTLISGDCQVTAMWTEDVKETMHTHTAGQWEIVREATATMPGESVLKCKECGEIMDTKVIPILTNTESNDNGFTDEDIVIDDSPEKDVEDEQKNDLDEDEEEETFFVGDEITTDTAIFTVTKTGENPSVEYTELFDEDVTDVSIPESITIYGVTYKVTAIAAKAFYKNTSIKKVTITSHVTKIGSKAFYGCTSLKNIVILSTKLKSSQIGTNAFTKVTKNVKVYVPQKNYKTYKKLLKKAGVGSKAKFIKLK